jgi:hypothetical protein
MKKSRFDLAAFGATVATLRRASLVQGFRRPDQGFRRRAADIDAGSADGALSTVKSYYVKRCRSEQSPSPPRHDRGA